MPDWTQPMQQTFEYYTVDPGTWKDISLIDTITSSSITRDMDTETLGSASIESTGLFGESYVRIYLITVQDGIREKFPLGTYLVQTPSSSFDGKVSKSTMDAYTPLIELKENQPALGYYIAKGENIMDTVSKLTKENLRAPVVEAKSALTVYSDFVANADDTWMTFISDLAANAKFYFDLDEMGRVLFAPQQRTESLQPVWTFNDDNSSLLYSDITVDHDLYGIPNVVEVIYSDENDYYYARVVNDDPNSPISTVSRGREIVQRESNPSFGAQNAVPTENMVREYAEQLLEQLSTLEYTVSYKHGYCPVRTGDCVRLNYTRAGIKNIKARVISQTIKCEPGCEVSEKAVFTSKLWR